MPSGAAGRKERGCFQCSQRRITCDRAEPSCQKCVKKGIECSGLSRIRFVGGAARRGRSKLLNAVEDNGRATTGKLPAVIHWPDEGRAAQRSTDVVANMQRNTDVVETMVVEGSTMRIVEKPEEHHSNLTKPGFEDDVDLDRAYHLATTGYTHHITPWIPPIAAEVRLLFSYFSNVIAPVMVVLDDDTNGYRSLILPMAFEDGVLRRAVMVVAAQHLSRRRPEFQKPAEAGRIAVVSRLRSDSMQQSADKVFNECTWATLIVLLVGETVTGSPDYGLLIRMLLSLSTCTSARDANSVLSKFLQAQTQMFELLGVPLLGEAAGVLTLQTASESLKSWLSYPHIPEESEDWRLAESIRQCFLLACDIYKRCAGCQDESPNLDESLQARSIQQLLDVVSQIMPDARGAHALVWVYFIAGAASTDPSQRMYFVHRLEHIYARTHFGNIPNAIQSVQKVWEREEGERWTVCVPRVANALVM